MQATYEESKISGHAVILENLDAARHVAILPPQRQCGSGGGSTVDATARLFQKKRYYALHLPGVGGTCLTATGEARSTNRRNTGGGKRKSGRVYLTSVSYGCRVAMNSGLFNTSSFACHGNLVSGGKVRHLDSRLLPHFGMTLSAVDGTRVSDVIRSASAAVAASAAAAAAAAAAVRNESGDGAAGAPSSFHFGYLSPRDVENLGGSKAPPFSSLVAGLVWLRRGDKNLVKSGTSRAFEDGSGQETGSFDRFINVVSGRAAIGLDDENRLVLVQVDGRSGSAGLSLNSFSSLCGSIGLHTAINVDGGGSVTLVRDGLVINVPSYSCGPSGALTETATDPNEIQTMLRRKSDYAEKERYRLLADSPDHPFFRCKRPVSSIICIHDAPVRPIQDSDSGKLLLENGCVCFDTEEFSLAEVAEAVDFGADYDAARENEARLLRHDETSHRQLLFSSQSATNIDCSALPAAADGDNSRLDEKATASIIAKASFLCQTTVSGAKTLGRLWRETEVERDQVIPSLQRHLASLPRVTLDNDAAAAAAAEDEDSTEESEQRTTRKSNSRQRCLCSASSPSLVLPSGQRDESLAPMVEERGEAGDREGGMAQTPTREGRSLLPFSQYFLHREEQSFMTRGDASIEHLHLEEYDASYLAAVAAGKKNASQTALLRPCTAAEMEGGGGRLDLQVLPDGGDGTGSASRASSLWALAIASLFGAGLYWLYKNKTRAALSPPQP